MRDIKIVLITALGILLLGMGTIFAQAEEATPWFFMMIIMLVCAVAWVLLGYFPKKWLPAIIFIIVVIALAGLFFVPEENLDHVQNQIVLPFFLVSFLILTFFGVRYQRKHNPSKSFLWQSRLMKMANSNIDDDIAYYNTMPYTFNDFMDVPKLSDGDLRLVCTHKLPAEPEKNWVPSYEFDIFWNSEKVGEIRLRIGYNEQLFFSGHIGYEIKEAHRGKDFAARAVRLIKPIVRYHNMEKLLIAVDDGNMASYRVCEKLGANHIRKALLPSWHDMHEAGHSYMHIFQLETGDIWQAS